MHFVCPFSLPNVFFFFFQTENRKEALDWYNYSLSLYTQSDTGDQNLAKLHRNRANCYLTLGELEKVYTTHTHKQTFLSSLIWVSTVCHSPNSF